MTVTKFRVRPVFVEAVRWDGTAEGAASIVKWIQDNGRYAFYWADGEWDNGETESAYIAIKTQVGQMMASPGFWITRSAAGDFYPYRPDIFGQTYETVSMGEDA